MKKGSSSFESDPRFKAGDYLLSPAAAFVSVPSVTGCLLEPCQ